MNTRRFEQRSADAATRAAVESALWGTPGQERADFLAVRIAIRRGVCELAGNVRSGPARCEAEQRVQQIAGVREVHNWLVADDALARHVERTLQRIVRSGIDGLQVNCLLGRIELRGHARGQLQRATAILAARRIPGVVEVTSALTVPERNEQLAAA